MMAEHLKENDDANLKRTLSNTVNGGVSNPNTGSATALKRALSSTIGGGGGGGNPRAATTLKRTLSSTVGGGGGGGGSRSTSTAKPTRFKEATRKIQTMKSATKGFKSSDELRDIVYKDWLTEKASLEMEHKQFKVQEKKFQEEKIRKKQREDTSQSVKKVEKWAKSKEEQLWTKRKQIQEEEKKKALEMEDKSKKTQDGAVASNRWREERKKQYVQQQREKKEKEDRKMKKMEEERSEKEKDSKHAFQHWNQNKSKVTRENIRKKTKGSQKLEQLQVEKAAEKERESKSAYEAWKDIKDEQLRTTKSMFTYNTPRGKVNHERSWCPARNIKYSYHPEKEGKTPKEKRTKKGGSDEASDYSSMMESYSTTSFESAGTRSSSGSQGDSSVGESISQSASPEKGRHKTIQVCCQTLEYWCTCKDNNYEL